MLILGLILFLIGWLLHFPFHYVVEVIGLILIIVGAVLLVLDLALHRPVGGRRWY